MYNLVSPPCFFAFSRLSSVFVGFKGVSPVFPFPSLPVFFHPAPRAFARWAVPCSAAYRAAWEPRRGAAPGSFPGLGDVLPLRGLGFKRLGLLGFIPKINQ